MMIECPYCFGRGTTTCDYCDDMDDKSFCPVCGGRRIVICPECNGSGKVEDDD